jgi:hypothetical protein
MRVVCVGIIGALRATAQRPTPIPSEESGKLTVEELSRLKPADITCPPCAGGRRYRWPVKTLTDRDWRQVRLAPVRQVTIADVQRFARPDVDMEDMAGVAARRVSPLEREVFRLRGRVRWILPATDRDVHLFLEDVENPKATMIVEVIDPVCYSECGHDVSVLQRLKEARAALEQACFFRPEMRWHEVDAVVTVTGVGFFDYSSGPPSYATRAEQLRAVNGFELHPVLDLQVDGQREARWLLNR